MKQYLDLLHEIIKNGVEKESGRANMPNTFGISHATIKMNLQEGFPLLTTKKMYLKGVIHELLWFLRGETNIKYLVDNNVKIWNDDGYRWYINRYVPLGAPTMSKEEWLEKVKAGEVFLYPNKDNEYLMDTYTYGDLDKVYGYQWRNQNGVDQVKEVLNGLKNNPYSRYHIIDAWNKADFKDMALPPCHLLYQFIVRPISNQERYRMYCENIEQYNPEGLSYFNDEVIKTFEESVAELDRFNVPKFYLDLNMYQRSCDTFLGVPFNIASMSLLLKLFAQVNNMVAGVATWIGGDTHLYIDHLDIVKEQLSREPYPLPSLLIKKELNSLDDILALNEEDFELIGYQCHPTLKAELFTGLKK